MTYKFAQMALVVSLSLMTYSVGFSKENTYRDHWFVPSKADFKTEVKLFKAKKPLNSKYLILADSGFYNCRTFVLIEQRFKSAKNVKIGSLQLRQNAGNDDSYTDNFGVHFSLTPEGLVSNSQKDSGKRILIHMGQSGIDHSLVFEQLDGSGQFPIAYGDCFYGANSIPLVTPIGSLYRTYTVGNDNVWQ